jgi:exodeoxyribonuclease V gamma subunit
MGSVNFATLMPMRAIPFKRVYILGMNDGDFPRHNKPLDFDLMANDYRPGDRSMREDDRYLFLEALLAARESLYISWIGRSIKDDSERPPSLLVSQLKDYVNKFWRVPSNNNAQALDDAVNSSAEILVSEAISCIHPLQAFSEQYFKASNPSIDGITQSPLFTYASEWRDAHTQRIARSNTEASNTNTSANSQSIVNRAANGIFEKAQSIPLIVPEQALNIEQLTRFMKKPVETFFKQALLVNFDTSESANNDRETFKPSALQQYSLESQLIENAILAADDENQAVQKIDAELRAMSMSGAMGLASSAAYLANELRSSMTSLASRYFYFRSALIALPQKRVEIDYRYDLDSATQLSIEAVVGNFTQARDGETRRVLISKSNTKGTENSDIMRFDNLLKPWLEHLVCHTRGEVFTTRVLAKEAKVSFVLAPLTSEQAKAYLNEILQVWTQGMQRPLPLESRAGFEFLYDINQLQQEMVTEQSAERDFNAALELDIASLKQKVTQAFEKRLENDKGYYRRAFGKNISIIDEREFQRLSEQLYLPLIRAVEEYDDEQY